MTLDVGSGIAVWSIPYYGRCGWGQDPEKGVPTKNKFQGPRICLIIKLSSASDLGAKKTDNQTISARQGFVLDSIGKLFQQTNALTTRGHFIERTRVFWIRSKKWVERRSRIFNYQG